MRAWIASRLDPIESYDPEAPPSDSESGLDLIAGVKTWSRAAVLVPLVEHEAGMTVLLTRRADAMRSHSGQVAFPGGRCDPGETPWGTALREAQEEIGLDPEHVTLAGLSTRYRTGTGYDITPVVGFVRPGFHLTPNPEEVAEIFETPFVFLMNPDNHERRFLDMEDGMRRHFYAMPYQDQLIWGVTAAMLRQLYERLYGEALPPPTA
jgi:8-oxo-dGTP pyrophosphatase MutT (NUDIX family)